MRRHAASRAPLLAALCLLCVAAEPAGAQPTQAAITVDGLFDDWALVLANPVNVAVDGDAMVGDCSVSTDRDCPVSQAARDMRRLAWTRDAAGLSFLAERAGASNGDEHWFLMVDANRDGRLQTAEPVIDVTVTKQGGSQSSSVARWDYIATDVAGDPMTDALGFADGHWLPGQLGMVAVWTRANAGHGPQVEACEWSLTWAELGIAPGSAVDFVLFSAGDTTLPGSQEDHLGAADGGVGSTAVHLLELSDALIGGSQGGNQVLLRHVVTNSGNDPALVQLQVVADCSFALRIERDLDGDGFGDELLARDQEPDGLFSGSGNDRVEAAGDSNGDGRLDLGILAPGEQATFILDFNAPSQTACPEVRIDVAVSVDGFPSAGDAVTDVLLVGGLTLSPRDLEARAVAGDSVSYGHRIQNATGIDRLVDLTCSSVLAWPCELLSDPNADGIGDDAVPLMDSDGNGDVDLVATAATPAAIIARLDVPPTAFVGTRDSLFVQLRVNGTVQDFAVDSTLVTPPLTLSPHHVIDDRTALHGPAGGSLFFPHRLRNARSTPETVEITFDSPDAWPVGLYDDPNGDGLIQDAVILDPASVLLPPSGQPRDVFVRVDLPLLATDDLRSRIGVTATSLSDPTAVDTVFDDAVVSIVTAWHDAGLTQALTAALPCQTAHGLASGLPPNDGNHRFAWRDPLGQLRALRSLRADDAGTATDLRSFGPGDELGDWTLALELSPSWLAVDIATLGMGDPIVTEGLSSSPVALDVSGANLSVGGLLRNESYLHEVQDLTVRWTLLSPDGASYLNLASGAFEPYTGSEASQTESVGALGRDGGTAALNASLRLAGKLVEFGDHAILVSWSYSCGWISAPVAVGSVLVHDDADGDGIVRDDEILRGTDPNDADSDDDGLLDGAEGLGDADADGVSDALDCDSDDDGLPDGLEAGVTTPDPDTDVAAGCFVADADRRSTTDPLNPDTDSGGIPDGMEDRDANGRVDAGEGDPRQAADDDTQCSGGLPPEVSGLRLARSGGLVQLTWSGAPPDCRSWSVLADTSASAWDPATDEVAGGLLAAAWTDPGTEPLRYYLVLEHDYRAGSGPLGR